MNEFNKPPYKNDSLYYHCGIWGICHYCEKRKTNIAAMICDNNGQWAIQHFCLGCLKKNNYAKNLPRVHAGFWMHKEVWGAMQ